MPIYLDWQFWAAVVAAVALILSQLPPVALWFRQRRLEVEVHNRVQITHKVGNPNVGLFVSVRNLGGRELRVQSLVLKLTRDNKPLASLAAQNFYEQQSAQSTVLFVPFILKPQETWAHGTNFLNFFDREKEKAYRRAESDLRAVIQKKLEMRPKDDSRPVSAEQDLVSPFIDIFNELFIWEPGEYIAELTVLTQPQSASFGRQYRFTLFESDSMELRSYVEDYKFGAGVYFNDDRHSGLFIHISR